MVSSPVNQWEKNVGVNFDNVKVFTLPCYAPLSLLWSVLGMLSVDRQEGYNIFVWELCSEKNEGFREYL